MPAKALHASPEGRFQPPWLLVATGCGWLCKAQDYGVERVLPIVPVLRLASGGIGLETPKLRPKLVSVSGITTGRAMTPDLSGRLRSVIGVTPRCAATTWHVYTFYAEFASRLPTRHEETGDNRNKPMADFRPFSRYTR